MTPFTALKNFSPFHFISLYIYIFFFTFTINPSLHFTLCVTLVIYQESLHDARSIKCKKCRNYKLRPLLHLQLALKRSLVTTNSRSNLRQACYCYGSALCELAIHTVCIISWEGPTKDGQIPVMKPNIRKEESTNSFLLYFIIAKFIQNDLLEWRVKCGLGMFQNAFFGIKFSQNV